MQSFKLTHKARSDLKSIAVYTQRKWGREQRRVYLKQIDDAFHLLARSPESGKRCDYIKKGYRKFPSGSHIIFYRANHDQIEIIRVLHKRMDVEINLESNQ